ncbi:hypothetical protein [Pseudomonas sp. NPDC089401]|uniref:hypothetical protein n=1 Tax=Pseudomonas sp. NPDC089401 TaxID=3364462 RepID=UPI0037F11A1B
MTNFNALTSRSSALRTSEPLMFKVRRQPQQDYPPPSVTQAPTGKLNPIDATSGATVQVIYDGMRETDSITVNWIGNDPTDTWSSAPQNGNAGGVRFQVPVGVVAASQSKLIEVHYVVVTTGNPGKPSLPLTLDVGTLAQTDLPIPVVPQATGDVLDLSTFPLDATVTARPWPLMAENQRYWIKASGFLDNGTRHDFYPAEGKLVVPAEIINGVTASLLRSELEKLGGLTLLTVTLAVAFDSANDETRALTAPPLDVEIARNSTSPEDFRSFSRTDFVSGVVMTSPTGMRFNPIRATSMGQWKTGFWNHSQPWMPLTIINHAIVELSLGHRFRSLSIEYREVHKTGHFIEFFDHLGSIGLLPLPIYTGGENPGPGRTETFTAPAGKFIHRAVINAGNDVDAGFFIMKFSWTK